MEKTQERVLAYTKARELTNEELSVIAGGSSGWNSTSTFSAGGSAGSGQPSEGHLDWKIDW